MMQNRYEVCSQLVHFQEDKFYPLSVNQRIVITKDKNGIAVLLAQELRNRRFAVEVCADTIPVDADVVIFLEGLDAYNTMDAAIARNRAFFLNGQRLASRFFLKGGLLLVVQDTGGQFGLESLDDPFVAWAAGISGFVKTAQLEWPKATCRVLDLQCAVLSPAQIVQELLTEVLHYRSHIELGLGGNGQRYGLTLQAPPIPKLVKLALPKNPVIVVSGGARGITAACLQAWSKKIKARFVLLGRTVLDPVEDT